MASEKGWIIPPEVSDKRKCIKIYIPDDTYDRGAFWGALYALTYSWNWRAGGDTPPQDMANMWAEIWKEAYDRSNGMSCCEDQPVLNRINPETGRPEVSYTNGTTWATDPNDPEQHIPLYPPLVTSTSGKTKCDAATNASEHFNDLIASTHTNLAAASTVFGLAQAVAEAALAIFIVIVSGGTLSPIVATFMAAIWAAAQGVFALGLDAYDAYWSEDKKDAVLCAIYCNIGDNGQFTEAQYQAFRAKVKDQLPASPALDIIMTSVNAGGARGLSQMASYGNAALADCSSCDCDTSTHVYISDLMGTIVEIFPDGTGLYTATQSGIPTGDGFYWIAIQFSNPIDTITHTPCHEITIVSGAPSYSEKYDCHTGNLDPLSHCAWTLGNRYNSGGGVMTFRLDPDGPCE